jgi:spore germination protein
MDVELALATEEQPQDNTIIDGFKTVEKTVEEYGETDFGPAFVSMQKKDENFKYLEGASISEKDAVKLAKKYAGFGRNATVKVTQNGKGSDFDFFSVSITNSKTKQEANMDITKKGGYPIWFMKNREVNKQRISLNDASNQAIKFLKDNGYKNLNLFESAQYDHVGVFNFVANEGDVRIYPDAIRVKVALDNGNIIGLTAEDYLKSHHKRDIPKPAITSQEAREKISQNVKVMEEGLAVIINDLNKEVLCFEFLGTMDNDTYRIFVNAVSGVEEKVEKLQNAEPVYEDVV